MNFSKALPYLPVRLEAPQEPNPEDVTSNTQWSIVFDNKNLTAQVALRRRWDEVHCANIHGAVS